MATPGWRALLSKGVLLASPLLALLTIYAVADPFRVLRRHASFYDQGISAPTNRDFVSTELLLAKDRAGEPRPDSFVFGNSRSLAFESVDWARVLPPGSHPFHFDASLESLFGVWAKVNYLDRNGYALRHVLLVVDADLLSRPNHSDTRAMYRKHPLLSGDSWWSFQISFVEAFLSHLFFVKYLDYSLFHQPRGYMAGALEAQLMQHVPATNDLTFARREAEISALGETFFLRHQAEFDSARPLAGVPTAPVLDARGRQRLAEISAVLRRQGTDLRIVVSPLYDQRPLNGADVAALSAAFGPRTVYDYSGPSDITADRHNYYESSHYRVAVARRVLETMYDPSRSAPPPT